MSAQSFRRLLAVPLRGAAGILLGKLFFGSIEFCFAEENIPQTVGDQKRLWVGLSFLMNHSVGFGSDRRMHMETCFFGLPRQYAEFLRKDLLLLKGQFLITEEDDTAVRDDDGEFSNQFIGIRRMDEIAKAQIGVLTSNGRRNLDIMIMIKAASQFERFASQGRRSNHRCSYCILCGLNRRQ